MLRWSQGLIRLPFTHRRHDLAIIVFIWRKQQKSLKRPSWGDHPKSLPCFALEQME